MKTQFTPIAMRFNEENWESIKDKIEAAGIGHNVWSTDRSYYLCNNWEDDNSLFIGNCSDKHSNIDIVDKVYETWDEAIFLRACGIEVDTYTVSKEFILEGHKAACSDWKAKIEAQFPDLFPEVTANKWYKSTDNESFMFYITDSTVDMYYGYGILGSSNSWYNKWHFGKESVYGRALVEATEKEVKTALIAEAKRRGFNKTTMITQTFDKNQKMCIGFWDESSVKFERNKLFAKGVRIFDNGKWAEITSEPIELTLEQIAEKFNVNVEQLKIKK